MSDIAIKVQGLGKKYQIRHDTQERFKTIRETMVRKISSLINTSSKQNSSTEDFWALKDVSFEIKKGECVGIIGGNGAGKSTLLKILSRITEPTIGRVELHGRVASLLEVGTGFHQELTGRENIYLNGTILGMTKKEIDAKFNEIVAFSEIEKFLDTPVKRYSSGMYVRLAFAVAAHLEPEILVVDEVLAVGDVKFQKKCLGKMQDVSAQQGRTVLFVSHNMAAISALCKKTIVLKDGKVVFAGDVQSGIQYYMGDVDQAKGFADLQNKKSGMWKQPRTFSKLLSIETFNENQERQSFFKMGDSLKIRIKLEIMDDREDVEVGVFIRDNMDTILGLMLSSTEGFKNIKKGVNDLQIEMPQINLMPGEYKLGIWIVHQREVNDACENAVSFNVISNGLNGNYVDYDRFKGYGSVVRSHWKVVN